jgi:uncharacterized protein with HEPN domain
VTSEDISLITKITEWARNALEYASGDAPKIFATDKKTAYACVLSVQQMGSLADRISLGARAETSHIPWDEMSMRGTKIEFDYSNVNLSRLSQTIKNDFPTLIQQMESAIKPHVMKNRASLADDSTHTFQSIARTQALRVQYTRLLGG